MRLLLGLTLALLLACEDDEPVGGDLDARVDVPTDAAVSLDALAQRGDASRDAASLELELDGHDYVLQSATGYQPLANTPVTLGFMRGRAHWNSGCNSAQARYGLEQGFLVLVGSVLRTDALCVGIAEQEGWFDAFYASRPQVMRQGHQLTLTGNGATLIFVEKSAGATPEESALDGRKYVLQSAVGYEPLPKLQVILGFDEGVARWNSGCNGSFGDFAITDGVLVVPSAFSTFKYCENVAVQEQWFNDFYISRPTITVAGDRLTLHRDGITLEYLDRELADPDRPLVGTPWTIDAFVDPGGIASYALPRQPELRFDANGELSVNTSCNDIIGKFVVNGSTVTLRDVAFTKQACNDELPARVDAHLGKLFRAPTLQFETDARSLKLTSEPGFGIQAWTP